MLTVNCQQFTLRLRYQQEGSLTEMAQHHTKKPLSYIFVETKHQGVMSFDHIIQENCCVKESKLRFHMDHFVNNVQIC